MYLEKEKTGCFLLIISSEDLMEFLVIDKTYCSIATGIERRLRGNCRSSSAIVYM
jgi:hypothetical protein